MTPLAHRIAKQASLPMKRRAAIARVPGNVPVDSDKLVEDIHCFEITGIMDLIYALCDEGRARDFDDDLMFLPAPNTWLEFRQDGIRNAWLVTDKPMRLKLMLERPEDGAIGVQEFDVETLPYEMMGMLISALALINTPQVIGRDVHNPNRGLERLLRRRMPGRYPLHAWHELKLAVAKPIDIDDGEPHEAHITGMRALHFCRSHLRVRLGKIEFVTSHWRGNAALGIKQTRYRVEKAVA